MKPKKIWANLAVKDLARTTKFYTELGFKPNMTHPHPLLTSFKFGDTDFIIHFFIAEQLREGLKGELSDLTQGNEIIFTLGAESQAEVDEWAREVETAGGTLVSQPEAFGEGYYGFVFADPDGHKFNVFFM